MTRFLVGCLFLACASASARAGELDKESTPAKIQLSVKAPTAAPTEMDEESPTPAHHWHGYAGYRVGFGYGFGYGSYFGGWGYSFYQPYFGFGFGYPAFFYSPYLYFPVGYFPYYRGFCCW
ncbi:MAG TPA: hypothetical protein VGJ05_13445 [Fimbriiglobus sp.]|jgi:hypothetical protein